MPQYPLMTSLLMLHVALFGCALRVGSHDRSMRRWERTSEPFFVEEEKERRLESLFEADLEQQQQRAQREAGGLVLGPEGGSFGAAAAAAAAAAGDGDADAAAAAGRRTIESVSAADAIIDALDVAANEAEKNEEYDRELRAAQVGKEGCNSCSCCCSVERVKPIVNSHCELRAVQVGTCIVVDACIAWVCFIDAL
jgi:hypothetical protein